MSKAYVPSAERTRSAFALGLIGLRTLPVSEATKIADQLARDLLALGLLGKAKP